MGLRRESAGIEGLPLQLLIVAIVMGITVPVVYASLDAYDHGQVQRRIEGELLRLTHAAQQYSIAGGGAETLALDLRGGTFTSLEYVRIGDRAGGPFANVVRYRISGDGERAIVVERPTVSMAAADGGTLVLGAAVVEIHLEVLEDSVVVSVAA